MSLPDTGERAASGAPPDLVDHVYPGAGGASVVLADRLGTPLVVVLGNRLTQRAGHDIVDALRVDPVTAEVPILQVAHLRGVPRSLHAVAERDIVAGRQKQVDRAVQLRCAAGLPDDGESAAIGLALDWRGRMGAEFGFGSRDREPVTIVADARLRLLTVIRADDPLPAVRSALQAAGDPRRSEEMT